MEKTDPTPRERKTRLSQRFASFCIRHSFEPAKTKAFAAIAVVIAVLLLLSIGLNIGNLVRRDGKTTTLGLKNIGELATQAAYYTNVQVIDKSRNFFNTSFSVPGTQTQIVFSYDGIIKAGVDFTKIEMAVDNSSKTIRLTMPAVRIQSNELDNDSLKIYSESKNLFTRIYLKDINASQTELKKDAEATALNNGLIEAARNNAEMLVLGFLSGSYDMSEYSLDFVWGE